MAFSTAQQQIADRFDSDVDQRRWHDWKWQVRHCIKDVKTFEPMFVNVMLS